MNAFFLMMSIFASSQFYSYDGNMTERTQYTQNYTQFGVNNSQFVWNQGSQNSIYQSSSFGGLQTLQTKVIKLRHQLPLSFLNDLPCVEPVLPSFNDPRAITFTDTVILKGRPSDVRKIENYLREIDEQIDCRQKANPYYQPRRITIIFGKIIID